MIRSVIVGTGSYLPDKVMTNDDWSKLVDTSDEWISTRTGIKERHFASNDQATSDLVCEAANLAIEDAEKRWEMRLLMQFPLGLMKPRTQPYCLQNGHRLDSS